MASTTIFNPPTLDAIKESTSNKAGFSWIQWFQNLLPKGSAGALLRYTDTGSIDAVSGVPGTTTNNNATAGDVGEFQVSTVATPGVSLSNNVTANVTSFSLTAGDWQLTAQVDFALTGVTSTVFQSGFSLTTGVLPTQPGGSGLGADPLLISASNFVTITATHGQVLKTTRLSIAAPTTVFLVTRLTFSVGTATAFGTLSARRMR
jgi:hypothetical protein